MKSQYIGQDKEKSYIFQELTETGMILRFNCFYLSELYSGDTVLNRHACLHKVWMLDGRVLETGNDSDKEIEKPEELDGIYECSVIYCEACGAGHNAEAYGMLDYAIIDECSVYCKECLTADQLLVEVKKPADFFKAKCVQGVDLDSFEEVETLFCDSSGMGSESEPALTKNGAKVKIAEIIKEYKGESLYAGITNMGQFQVYVSIFKKSA